MRRLWLLLILLPGACASEPIKKIDLTALAAADAQVLQGCYDCLLEARATYERVGVGKARPIVLARLFEVQLLITLREGELAMDRTASLAHAQVLAKELPPLAEADRYLALVELVPPDGTGTPHRELRAFRLSHEPKRASVNDELAWLKTATGLREPAREYLSLAVDCGYIVRPGRPGPMLGSLGDLWTGSTMARAVPEGASPLVAYRISICDDVATKGLEDVRGIVPQFAETAFFLARPEVANAQNTGGAKAQDYLTEAYKRFPASPSITYLSAQFKQTVGDCREALRFYDETIAIKNVHENALLGRTMCLSYLKRNDEAIATATRMIDLQTDNWGDAFYWRAWNQHVLQHLELARSDIDRAKTLTGRSEAAFTLAGMIEHDQTDLDIAESDLVLAKALNRQHRNCVAMWYLGLVKLKREQWLESGKNFEDSLGCYTANVTDDEQAIKSLQTSRDQIDPDFKARQIASFQAALADDQRQQYAAAFNAANFYAHGGNTTKAKEFIDIAAKDPGLADKVAQLRQILKDK
jgi:tetratricopeptide (TPR) repeat protein